MGFFDFLRKKEPAVVNFSELDEWLDKQLEEKKLGQKVEKAKSVVRSKVKESFNYLAELEKAALLNPNIPDRAKHIMEGHRKFYVQRLKRFLDEIEVPDDYSEIGHCAARFSESITKLSEETQKNYLVLREFVEKELSKVIKSIKAIEDELSALQRSIEAEGLELIREARIRLKHYRNDIDKKIRLENEKQRHHDELSSLHSKKQKYHEKIKELKESNDYARYKSLLEEKNKHEESLKELEKDLSIIFAELNRPLRKYKHGSLNEDLIDKYLLDPLGALESDHSLVINEVLSKMSQGLHELELKEHQVEKAVELISKLSKEFLTDKRIALYEIKSLNKDVATKINTSVAALNMSESETLLRNIEQRIIQVEQAIAAIEKDINEISLDYAKQKVKEKVKEIMSDITINDE
ncbi:hypothetical protein JXB28_01170 [Candidatus Woesearchaeota archaeon]|nr:hypothetical protein [Candidatus Woesearchaeota archaeon]